LRGGVGGGGGGGGGPLRCSALTLNFRAPAKIIFYIPRLTLQKYKCWQGCLGSSERSDRFWRANNFENGIPAKYLAPLLSLPTLSSACKPTILLKKKDNIGPATAGATRMAPPAQTSSDTTS